ncbi:MAG: hypothetical protein AMS26_06275 [Bacteroides sp. SM23_62]|nr:MAG: hypothetical protein AMS26_06275 [Bacteroides sp. SM23_62]
MQKLWINYFFIITNLPFKLHIIVFSPKTIRNFNSLNIQIHVSLKNLFAYLIIILILASCKNEQQSPSDGIVSLYPAPQTIGLNTGEGYIINPLTGDSIQPIVNSFGAIIKTGVPVPAKGKAIHPDSVAKPKIIPAGEPKEVAVHLNIHKIPEALTVIKINKNSLATFTTGEDTSFFVLVNSSGDTLPTGVPIPITGKVVPCIQPQSVKALPPDMKDNANINMKYLDVDQGMNSSYVLSILEDSRGNLWFGSWGGGVSMYNGESFTHFTRKEGLSDHRIQSILEDSHGNLWFGTFLGGVSKYNGEVFTYFTEKEGLSSNNVRSVMEDSQGNIWFGTGGGGVSRYNGENITHFTQKEGLSSNYVLSIMEDSHGNLWFCTEDGGVNMYDGKTFTHFMESEGLNSISVTSILEDSRGNIWFGTGGRGVSMYDGNSVTRFTEKEGLSNNTVRSILEDSYGNLWFGTEGGGVSMYSGDTFIHYTQKEGLSNDYVWSILEDSQHNLWFGTWGSGVSMFNREFFSHFTEKEGLSNAVVWSILEDRHGNHWFGTEGGGVVMYNGESFLHFTEKEGLSDNYVRSIVQDSHGNLWFGNADRGVSMFNGKSFTHFTVKEGLSSNNVRSILEDSHGNLWFGTAGGGVSRFNGQSFTHFTEKQGLSNDVVRSILEDSHGNLWFATYGGGVSKFNGETFMHFTEKEGLSYNAVISILEDSHGNLWIGTSGGGVNKYNGESFTYFTEKEGLSNNIVYSILEDANSNIWLSTEKGLNLLIPGPDSNGLTYKNPAIHTYGLQDGLKGLDFYPNSGLLDSKNRIWWGSNKSLTILDLNNFKTPVAAPNLQLNRIEINEQYADYRQMENRMSKEMKFNGVAKFYNYPLNLELPYNRNHIAFHFSAIDWAAPHKLKYSYKMEGLNDAWSLPTSEAKADYRSLPFGTYTFKVQAIGAAQKWSEPFGYTFTINPPWWHTWAARAGYAITALLIIFGFVRLRTAQLKQRHKELEAEVDMATQKIRAQKEEVESQRDEIEAQKEEIESQRDEVVAVNEALEKQKHELELTLQNLKLIQSQLIQSEKMACVGILTAGIAHELNNPINYVSNNVSPLLRDVNDVFTVIKKYEEIVKSNKLESTFGEADELKDKMDFSFLIKEIIHLLEGIEEGANRSGQIVKGLRSFSRLDEEKWQLYDVHEGIDSTLILLHNKIKDRIKVRKEYGDLMEIECFPSKINQVIMNVLSNSIQAIDGKGEIFIQTVSSGIGIKIIIKDNGKGMTPEVKKHIFEPFFTTKEVGQGTGLGLSISYGIIEQHQGNIDVISEPGKGTEFIISLPITQEGSV